MISKLLRDLLGLMALSTLTTLLVLKTELVMPIVLVLLVQLGLVWHLCATWQRQQRQQSQWLAAVLAGDLPLEELEDPQTRLQIQQLKATNARYQAHAEQQRLFLDAILQHLEVAVLVIDEQGTIQRSNRAWLALLQQQSPQLLAQLPAAAQTLQTWLAQDAPEPRVLLQWQQTTLLACVSHCQIHGQSLRLVTLQSIASELADQEQRAWQQMVRVLTHEIRNSITPMASLAGSAQLLLEGDTLEDPEVRTDLQQALQTIERRAVSLDGFIYDYQKLTRLPQPNPMSLSVRTWVDETLLLLTDNLQGIRIECQIADDLYLFADRTLLDQLLINLLRNAIEALAGREDPCIELRARRDNQARLIFYCRDHGCGVAESALSQLFVPFFSTKADGSGIGLSLARQIMLAHGGTIAARNHDAGGLEVKLQFS